MTNAPTIWQYPFDVELVIAVLPHFVAIRLLCRDLWRDA